MNIRRFRNTMRCVTVGAALAVCTMASAAALETGRTTASQLNIRTEPFGPVITMVPEGTDLAILASDGQWAQVSVDGVIGFASMDYIDISTEESDVAVAIVGSGTITADDVNFRTGPSTSSQVIGRFQNGTSVAVAGVMDGWFEVEYNGQVGYVHPDYLIMTGDELPESALPSITNTNISLIRQQVLEFAAQFLGTPYKYGGANPTGFDCSGFTYYVYKNVVKEIPRTASDQKAASTTLTVDELLPGDLVFFRNGGSGVGHAGIYVGEGQFIHSPNSGDYVSYDTLLTGSYHDTFICGGRFIND